MCDVSLIMYLYMFLLVFICNTMHAIIISVVKFLFFNIHMKIFNF